MLVEPRAHTPRNPNRQTLGGAVAKVGQALGRPLIPWQRRASDVVNELDPATGLLWYSTVVIRVQRQAGKTDLIIPTAHHRGLTRPSGRFWYTAQSGIFASEFMRDEFFERLESPQFVRLLGAAKTPSAKYLLSRRNGREAILWKKTRARFQAFPPTKTAMHSKQSDWTCVDEAWAHDAEKGAELRQAIRPTMNTRVGSQLWVVSAGGDDQSAYLNDYVELGQLSLTDPNSRTAFIDYGVPPNADLEDLAVIAKYHPAFGVKLSDGRTLFDMDRLTAARDDFKKDPAGFARAYATVTTGARVAAFPPAAWTECGAGMTDAPADRQIAFDVTPDGSRLAIGAAYPLDNGGVDVELVYTGPNDPAGVGLLARLFTRSPLQYDPRALSTLALVDDLARLHPEVSTVPVGAQNVAAGCGTITRHVLARTLRHHHQSDLDTSAQVAVKSPAGDGGFTWSRSKSQGSVAELYAVTLAARAALATPAKRRPAAHAGTRRK